MTAHFRRFSSALIIILLANVLAASAQTPLPSLSLPTAPAQTPIAPSQPTPPPQPAPQINMAEITDRANNEVGFNIQGIITEWQRDLDRIEKGLREPGLRYADMNAFRENLARIRKSIDEFGSKLRPRLDAMRAQVDRLGAAPAQGQAPEPEQAAKTRLELNYHLGIYTSALSAIDNGYFRIDQLINLIQDTRRQNFTNRLFEPVPNIFARSTWENTPANLASARDRIGEMLTNWWNGVSDQDQIVKFVGAAALMWLLLTILAWRGVRRLRAWTDAGEPPFWRRASSAAGVILLRSLPVIVPTIFLYHAVAGAQPLPERVAWLLYAAARSLIIVFAVYALITTVFAPTSPRWRLIPASDSAARRICFLVMLLAVVYGVATLIYTATRQAQAPFALTIVQVLPTSLLLSGLVIAILRTPLHGKATDGLPSLQWLRILRIPVWLITFAIIITAFTGYLALSRFLAQQLIVTGTILAVIYLMLLWVDGFAQGITDDSASTGRWLKESAGLEQQRRDQLAVPISLTLKLAVLIASVPLILLQWGYAWPDIIYWYSQLFFGFRIGNTQVSLAAVLASILVFVLGYFASRLFQGWLDAQVLKPAGVSGGVRDSIRTGVGYIGIFVAGLIALSYAGFNLSNLAIVAGAFSVGIGFGLQSVVSNFVSGLILLAERPIKVGDLVLVAGEEGHVRKISVRSTEIETFDRAQLLIPNSFFMTEKVKNFTLRNNIGRVVIPVGVAYGCDPRKVKATLLNVAQNHLDVMNTPAPFVDFEEFGADTLNFKLCAYIHDLSKTISVRTDLRIGILEAFDAEGIGIPSRQTDVTIREMDWLREAVTQYMSQPGDAKPAGNGQARLPRPTES